ncbi:growth inhibitor PemK [Phenylobacterium montanum]|uniref:Growth inhibitor PemK n=1 Tax=Phenylobacterium montanum TaxID=2823693 RepID=A0A975FY70_9CAUL|nr:growth inhibitor PemK [Caulobacter sp. S6]QUD87605.1 growth inhibitor PemK [Caulobacter sp. S6]
MTWPDPRPGLVIRYAYLWRREHDAGQDEGVKDRPCAIVVAVDAENDDKTVYVLPITHSPPSDQADAIELPQATKLRLGLDSDRSWIVVSEGNSFIWPGPDLRPRPGQGPESVAFGMLPPALFRIIKQRFLMRVQARRTGIVPRTE